jgi:hypothetical protein
MHLNNDMKIIIILSLPSSLSLSSTLPFSPSFSVSLPLPLSLSFSMSTYLSFQVWCEVFVDHDTENIDKKLSQTLPQLPLISKRKPSKWVHLDPCEAAVGENFIYESWGKSQNYIVAVSQSDVKDVTELYTTKFNETVLRRLESGVNQTYVDSLLRQASEEIKNYTRIDR